MAADEPKGGRDSRTERVVEKFADHSTGLPRNAAATSFGTSEKQERNQLLQLAGMGIQFGGTVVLFLLIGRWIDKHFGWKFAATLTMMALALIGSFYLLIKEVSRTNK